MRKNCSLFIILSLIFNLFIIDLSFADDKDLKLSNLKLESINRQLTVSFSFERFIPSEFKEKLTSGVTNYMVMKVYLVNYNLDYRVFKSIRLDKILFDLWDENFTVTSEYKSKGGTTAKIGSLSSLLRFLGIISNMKMISINNLSITDLYYIICELQLNPIPADVLNKARKGFTDPYGHKRGGSSRFIFGSFAQIFFKDDVGKEGNVIRIYSDLFRFTDILQPVVPDEYTRGSNSVLINPLQDKEDVNKVVKESLDKKNN